ncbi:TlpA disulfide reductase family protein [Novipirellula aureliae]|uniref:TlpA disulfide reductase family protein n=1 Tax=Novipirellula aureliae TaxID=2527966 RepID=UPI0018CD25DA|nr:TlpA disulfide reductase family protein [Novipirellula aureliae]
MDKNTIRRGLRGVIFLVTCTVLVSATATAQPSKLEPTLVAGSEVNLSSVMAAEWVQGEAPTTFEPGKVYMFECWATWCGPCIALIPHVNELHEKYYDKGLRVYGMSSWEDDKGKVEKFVQKKGAGMSYPVAYTGEGSAFETEWLTAAGVKAIPYAFIVRNGKLLLSTEASRLTDSLVETLLSGDEGAKQAAAEIKAAYDARDKTESLIKELHSARRRGDVTKMAAIINELESLDPNHPQIPTLKLQLLVARKEWPAAVAALNEMPASESKNSFLMMTGMRIAMSNGHNYPTDFTKALTASYYELVKNSGQSIGPNHFACLSILHWRIGDKQTAAITADKGVEVAMNFSGASESRTGAFVRFAKSVKEGTMPKYSDLAMWQREAKEKATATETESSQDNE